MNRKIIFVLLGCVAVLGVAIVAFGMIGGGLDRQLRARAEAAVTRFEQTQAQFTAARQEIESAIAAEPTLFAAEQTREPWPERLDEAAKDLKLAAAANDQLKILLEQNQAETAKSVTDELRTLETARNLAMTDVLTMRDTVRRLTEFRQQLDSKLPEMERDFAAVESFDVEPLQRAVDKAVADWPAKEEDLERRLALYRSSALAASEKWEATATARRRAASGDATGDDVVTLIELSTLLDETSETLAAAPDELNELIDQLYWSWDKMLVDVEIQEGDLVGFRQQFQTVRTRVVIAPEAKDGETKKAPFVKDEPVWKTVDKSTFESMKDKLGMSVQHKPAGKFDHEATSLVQPPGYAQMCPVKERSNHYGYWRSYGSGYHWYFYPAYYPMSRYYWGREHSPVTNAMYDNYDARRRTGQTYFGRDSLGNQLYGSSGAVTKRNYSSSRYISTNGFRNTQYVKSGGTYRGSRFAQPAPARRSSSYRNSSYSRSGSRSSFGGK